MWGEAKGGRVKWVLDLVEVEDSESVVGDLDDDEGEVLDEEAGVSDDADEVSDDDDDSADSNAGASVEDAVGSMLFFADASSVSLVVSASAESSETASSAALSAAGAAGGGRSIGIACQSTVKMSPGLRRVFEFRSW